MQNASPQESPLARTIRQEIETRGPMRFERFMELALYHPALGYYVRGAKPVGRGGDFFTASQMQPSYGILMRRYAERLCAGAGMDLPPSLTEFGAGRGEMAGGFPGWNYRPVEVDSPPLTEPLSGLVFANELLDAFPVNVGVRRDGRVFEKCVVWGASRFEWREQQTPTEELEAYARRWRVPEVEGLEFESHERGIAFLREHLQRARNALFIFVDYGFTEREWKRFPAGTLMAYRAHRATPDVLGEPGERDITAHVPFYIVAELALECGAELMRMERLAQALLFAGEPDSFDCVLRTGSEQEEFSRRQQLKTLLYGLGESFYVISIRKR